MLKKNSSSHLLTVQNLSAAHGEVILFEKLSFNLKKGETLLVKGPNGIGKTTLLKILAKLQTPLHGSIKGNDHLTYLGVEQGLKLNMTPLENLKAWQWLYGKDDNSQNLQVLKIFGLHHLMLSPCHHLSTGQRQRLHIAKLCLTKAPLWILDEPAVNLDKDGLKILQNLIVKHTAAEGKVIIAAPDTSWIKGETLDLGKQGHGA